MSKNTRWTIYTAIIIGVMGGGYYMTFTKSPDSYTPRDLPAHMEESIERERERERLQKLADSVDDEQSWSIEVEGVVEEVQELQSDQDADLYIALTVDHDFEDADGIPELDAPIRALAPQTLLDMTLDRLPESGDRLLIESQGTSERPEFLTIEDLRFVDGN